MCFPLSTAVRFAGCEGLLTGECSDAGPGVMESRVGVAGSSAAEAAGVGSCKVPPPTTGVSGSMVTEWWKCSRERARLSAQPPWPIAVSLIRGHEPKIFSPQPGFAAFHSLPRLGRANGSLRSRLAGLGQSRYVEEDEASPARVMPDRYWLGDCARTTPQLTTGTKLNECLRHTGATTTVAAGM